MLKCFSNPAMHDDMPIGEIKEFWSTIRWRARIAAGRGTAEYFRAVDALREADDCEPYDFSELIHGYSKAAGLHVLDIGCGNGYVLSPWRAGRRRRSDCDCHPPERAALQAERAAGNLHRD